MHYERDPTPRDRLNLIVRHELARYELPNEQVQQAPHLDSLDPSLPPGTQLETASNIETMGIGVVPAHVFVEHGGGYPRNGARQRNQLQFE